MLSRFDRLLGVRFRLHPLFTIVLGLAALTGHVLEIVTMFGIVLIHELGHAAMAGWFGWRVREIRLTPFGGVAATDEDGAVPSREEAAVALAGPAMNGLMIAFGYGMLAAGVWSYAWTMYFVQANLSLMLFNLLPVLPLDGGKLLRVGLGWLLPYYRTMRATTYWSMLASAAMAGYALTRLGEGGLAVNLLYIGSFLMYSNWHEWKAVPFRFIRFLLGRAERIDEWRRRGVPVEPIVVDAGASLGYVVRLWRRERPHWVVVLEGDGRVLGVVPEERCTKHYLEKEQHRAVSELFM